MRSDKVTMLYLRLNRKANFKLNCEIGKASALTNSSQYEDAATLCFIIVNPIIKDNICSIKQPIILKHDVSEELFKKFE